MRSFLVLTLAACSDTSVLPPAPTPGPRACESLAPTVFCDDFDGTGQDVSPFGFLKINGDGASGARLAPLVVDGNAVFAVSETAATNPTAEVPTGVTPLVALDVTQDITLQFAVELTTAPNTPTGVAFLDVSDLAGDDVLLEVFVAVDGSVSIVGGSAVAPLQSTAVLDLGVWSVLALHATGDGANLQVSLDAAPVGEAFESALAPSNVPLHFTPTRANGAVGIDVEDMLPHAVQFDDVALTIP